MCKFYFLVQITNHWHCFLCPGKNPVHEADPCTQVRTEMSQGESQAEPARLTPDAWGDAGESHIHFRALRFASFPSWLAFWLVILVVAGKKAGSEDEPVSERFGVCCSGFGNLPLVKSLLWFV